MNKHYLIKVFVLFTISSKGLCTIDGLKYTDALNFRNYNNNNWPKGEDPCNPLYWFPKNIPDECRCSTTPKSVKQQEPIPVPIPVPVPPQPIPMLPPMPIPFPMAPPPQVPFPMPPPLMPPPLMPPSIIAVPPIPYGIPLAPTNPMMAVGGLPYPPFPSVFPQYPFPTPHRPGPQAGLVPRIPGMVSPDGGINIMPFSDVYADLLERHKQKMIRKHLEKLVEKYDGFAGGYSHRKSYRKQNSVE